VLPLDVVLERLTAVRRAGSRWTARCPAHADRHPSLSVAEGDDGRVLLKCFVGCTVEAIVAALGLEMHDLFTDARATPGDSRAIVQHPLANPHPSTYSGASSGDRASVAPLHANPEGLRACTLESYSEAKGLPVEFLRSLQLEDAKYAGRPAIRMPYPNFDGEEQAARFRIALEGDDKFRWKKRSKLCLYGLPRLRSARERGFAVLVEGESCTQTLWLHGFPALGLPGAANWKDERDLPAVEGLDTLYVVIEPDKGGLAVLEWLRRSALTTGRRPRPAPLDEDGSTEVTLERVTDGLGRTFDSWRETPVDPPAAASARLPRVKLVSLEGAKDVSELYLQDRESFAARFENELQRATPYEEHERIASEVRGRAAWERASALAREPRILDLLERELDGAGVVGERRLCKLLYLAVNARHLDRFASIAIKGPSASGKSWTIEKVLDFFPPEAYYLLTAMSERALAYGTEPLSHRFLVLFEAAGLESEFASYLVRSLLSEGCLRYETVEKGKNGELVARLVQREGPTGLIVSTTSVALHPENETRLLSLSATDTAVQTKLVLSRLAEDDVAEPDYSRWHAFQIWLATAEHRVAIPYAPALADLVPPVAVRLRRDFRAVLSLIRSHAILHQASRERDDNGRVIATLEDYAIVRELVVDLVSEGVEATVPPTVRETVQAVSARASEDGVSITALAGALNLDKTSTSRRWNNARARGYLKNLETGRGKPARIVLADPLPDDQEILPTPERLRQRCSGADPPKDDADAPPSTLDTLLISDSSIPELGTITTSDRTPDPSRVLLERHEVGPHAIELWAPPPEHRSTSTCSASGTVIGTCMRCGGGVGDKDWTFAAWDGTTWRFSGYTLPGARRLATLNPLLGAECALRVKYRLIAPPEPDREPAGETRHRVVGKHISD
jgi:hypothetical protein